MGSGFLGLLASICLSVSAPALAEGDGPTVRPVFIELFTSQGCSSCPPADKLMATLAHQPGVIALSLPVDLWDYVGWKDTLAMPYHSQRQRQYAKARGDNRVYTPQAVINGIAHAVGSDPAAIMAQADMCFGRDGALSVAMRTEMSPGGLKVEIGAATENAPKIASLWLVRVASSRDVQIKRGENAGHTFSYVNVARGFLRIGDWKGEAASFTIPKEHLASADADGWMLLLQASTNYRPGVILAAAKSPGL
ncbi:MAG: DUF1223 domain-containing protein [Beijerinckiaceae bacterium]|nr:DUF1223 domain-containing protein [Beijerinckiaceae bacterium]